MTSDDDDNNETDDKDKEEINQMAAVNHDSNHNDRSGSWGRAAMSTIYLQI